MDITKILSETNIPLRNKSSILDKNAFLKILTVQLSNQDPLNAKDNTEYIAQMAQFSSLEQMQNLNSTMEKFLTSQKFSQAINMIGKEVEVSSGEVIEKVKVESAKLFGKEIYLISNGVRYNIDDVIGINEVKNLEDTNDKELNILKEEI